MAKRLTRRFLCSSLDGLSLSSPIRYERYYIHDGLRIQKKNDVFEKEELDEQNVVIRKVRIDEEEFNSLKKQAYQELIRDSFLYLEDTRVSLKKYYGDFSGLIRVEVSFSTEEEQMLYQKECWMGKEITSSALAFDKYLSKLSRDDFLVLLNQYK